MSDRNGRPARVADTLGSVLGPDVARALRPHLAKAIWAGVVGPQVSAVTQPVAIRGGSVLYVRVKNPVWANELTLLRGDILIRINKELGGPVLTDIAFGASGLVAEKRPRKTAPLPRPGELGEMQLGKQAMERIEQVVRNAPDAALAIRLRRSLIHAAQAAQWRQAHGWRSCSRCGTLAFPFGTPHLCGLCRIQPTPL